MTCLKSLKVQVRGHGLRLEVISDYLGLPESMSTSTVKWINPLKAFEGLNPDRQLDIFVFSAHQQPHWGLLLLWVWLNAVLGCERKSAGSRGAEPCHPVVTGHTCLLFPENIKS